MKTQLPPGPNAPSWWQFVNWIADPLGYLKKCRDRYGDVFTLRILGSEPSVIIADPQGIQEIFSKDSTQFDIGRSNNFARSFVGNNSLFLYDAQRHQRERKLLMPPFHGQRLHSYARSICDITRTAVNSWHVGQTISMRREMQEITLQVILQVIFGLSEGERYRILKSKLTSMLDVLESPRRASYFFIELLQQDWGELSPWGRIEQRRREIHALLQAEIDERRSLGGSIGNDVLSLMLSATDETGQKMSDGEIKDELLTMLIAGHETTATSLAWAFDRILRHPEIWQRIRQDLDELGFNPSPWELTKLPYLNAAIAEVLRMHPVLMLTFRRITKSSLEIMGRKFPAETWLSPSIYLVHHREDLYPEPEKFKPERFLERSYSPYEYFPFGGGSRRCLGHALAELEMKLVLSTILSECELALLSDRPLKAVRRGLTIAPAGGVRATFQGKRTARTAAIA